MALKNQFFKHFVSFQIFYSKIHFFDGIFSFNLTEFNYEKFF